MATHGGFPRECWQRAAGHITEGQGCNVDRDRPCDVNRPCFAAQAQVPSLACMHALFTPQLSLLRIALSGSTGRTSQGREGHKSQFSSNWTLTYEARLLGIDRDPFALQARPRWGKLCTERRTEQRLLPVPGRAQFGLACTCIYHAAPTLSSWSVHWLIQPCNACQASAGSIERCHHLAFTLH